MIKFQTILACFLLCLPAAILAQAPPAQSDPAARHILDQVSARFKSYTSIKASFTLTIAGPDGTVNGRKTGSVYMKGIKYRINLPPNQEIYCDGTTTWNYDKSTGEVKIDKVDPSSTTITPQKLFTDFYNKDFLYKMNEDTKIDGKSVHEIELTPFDKTKPFYKVLVYVDKAGRNIVSARVFQKDGTRFSYSINTFLANSPTVTDSLFIWDQSKHPGVEVVDLR